MTFQENTLKNREYITTILSLKETNLAPWIDSVQRIGLLISEYSDSGYWLFFSLSGC